VAFERGKLSDLVACLVLSLCAAAIVAGCALRGEHLAWALLVLASACATLGCAFPHRVRLVGLSVALGVPLGHLAAHALGLKHPTPSAHLLWIVLPIVPAIVAAWLGGLLRRAASGSKA